MFYFFFILRSSLDDFRRNKLRTLLTSLGILIGISSVVLLLALGLGLRRYIQDQFSSLGANLIMITPGKMLSGGLSSGSSMMSGGMFDEKDAIAVKRIKNLTAVVPIYVKYTEVIGPSGSEVYEMLASNIEIFPLMNFKVQYGRLYDKSDVDRGNKVMVLGSNPAKKLFGNVENAVGKKVKMENMGFTVVGVLESKGGGGGIGPSIDDHAFIPYKAALSFNPSKKFWGIYAKAGDETILASTKTDITNVLLKRYHDDEFSVNDQMELLNSLNTIFNMVNMVLVAIAAISLVVGGVGVMNIMYVTVVERVSEIGVRRAFGARKSDILILFLTEAVILSLIGGILGLALSFTVVSVVQKFFPAYIDNFSILLAIGVSSVIGIVFGVFPARQAANLTPIEAIRNE